MTRHSRLVQFATGVDRPEMQGCARVESVKSNKRRMDVIEQDS